VKPRLVTITAAELAERDFPPVAFVVPGYVAEGLTVIAGRPKTGKSWLALGWAIAVATGGVALGSIEVEAGDVLYLALEDNQRRLKKRLEQILPDVGKPDRPVAASMPFRTPRRNGVMFPGVPGRPGMPGIPTAVPFTAL
jgi:hypothetical protein